jgi:hypothetical protein
MEEQRKEGRKEGKIERTFPSVRAEMSGLG